MFRNYFWDRYGGRTGLAIAHFGKEWWPGTQTKPARIYGIVWGGGGGQSEQPLGIVTRHATCWVPLCTNNFRNSPGLAFHRIPKTRHIHREYVRLFRNADLKLNSDSTGICILLVFLELVKSPRHIFLQLHIFMFFFLSIAPSFLLFWVVLTPLKHSTRLSAMFVYMC